MRLVFINRFFFPDHSATSQMLTDLCFGLAAMGHEIHVVTSRLRYDDPEARLAPEEVVVAGVNVHRVWTSRFGRSSMLGRAADYLTFYLSTLVRLIRLADRDTILIAKTDPPMVSVIAAVAASLRRARLVNWLQDVFPEIARQTGMRIAQGPLGWLLKALRDASLLYARANVVLGDSMGETIAARGVPRDRIRVIHNWADDRAVTPLRRERNALRAAWDIREKCVVGYSGNMGRVHEFETLLSAAARLSKRADVVFLFIGAGGQRDMLERRASAAGLGNVVFKPYQDQGVLRESLGAMDVHVITQLPAVEGLVVPSKLYGILAAGRPAIFIGPTGGEVARILGAGECGLAFAPGDADGVVRAIEELAADPARREAMGANARRMLEARFSRAAAIAAWEGVLREAAG